MRGQVVALGGVEDLGAIRQNRPALAAHFVAAAAAAGVVLIDVCKRRQRLLGVGYIGVIHTLSVVLRR